MRKFLSLTLALLLVLCTVTGCGGKKAPANISEELGSGADVDKEIDDKDDKEENPMVTISVKDFGDMVFELYPEHAPETVANFLELAEEGFYKGLTFHRIYKGFMIQGGSTDGMGMAGSDKKIKGEFSANGVDNPVSHERGVISMARTSDPDSASSQFFICDADSEFLGGQ